MHLQRLRCKVTVCVSEALEGRVLSLRVDLPANQGWGGQTRWGGKVRWHCFQIHFVHLDNFPLDYLTSLYWKGILLNACVWEEAHVAPHFCITQKLPVNGSRLSDGDSFMFQHPEADCPLGRKHDVSALSELCIKEADASLPKALYVQHGYTTVCWLSST